MLADGRTLRHRLDHRSPEVFRVRAREADSLDAIDCVARPQQLAEVGADTLQQITAVRIDVLAEQRDLAHSVACELLDLGEDLARAAALLAPADGRDDAIGALRVAAHRDLHPGLEASLAMHRQAPGETAVVETEASPRHAHPAGGAGNENDSARHRRNRKAEFAGRHSQIVADLLVSIR